MMPFPKVKLLPQLHLLACLVLVLGTIPAKSEDPQCYSCDRNSKHSCVHPEELNSSIANCSEGACFKSGWLSHIQRGCYSKAKADCILKNSMIEGNCYYPGDNKDLDEQLKKCFEETKREGNDTIELPRGGNWKSCVCTGDLCNDGPVYTGTGLSCSVDGYYNERRCEEGAHCLSEEYGFTGQYGKDNRACMDARGVDCFKKKYGDYSGKKCMTLKTDKEKWEYDKYLRSCSNNTAKRLTPTWQTHTHRLKVCLCDSNDCNPAGHPTSADRLMTLAIIGVLSVTKVYSM